MVTGIECAGLVLAVMPLFIEAAKSYKKGVDTILDVSLHSRRDEKLEEFYEDLWWEMFLLDRQIREIVEALPYLSDKRKTELAAAEHLEDWTAGEDVAEALLDFFKSETDFNTYMVIMTKIVQLLAEVVKDSVVRISRADVNQTNMYNKLKNFQIERKNNQASSTFEERFRFWKKEKDRSKCLKALRTWNKRLVRLTEEARKEPVLTRPSSTTTRKEPSQRLRELSRALYTALAKYWKCNCGSPHEVRFCLKQRDSPTGDPEKIEVDFDFLFSTTTDRQDLWNWREGTVLVRSRGDATRYDCSVLNRLCDAIQSGVNHHSLRFLIEGIEEEQTMWQLRPQPKRLHFLETAPAVSLQSLLLGATRLPLIVKRRLAVVLANSLLQLHEGVWRSREWSKGKITFFWESADSIDYQRPYVTARFEDSSVDFNPSDMNIFHRNPSILALGILLIEIHTGRPIESYRTLQDLTNGQEPNANTDWLVADRVVKSLDDCSLGYKSAIQACLDTAWIPAGQKVSLDDPITRDGVYRDIVQPLEDELTYLFRERF